MQRGFIQGALRLVEQQAVEGGGQRLPQSVLFAGVAPGELPGSIEAEVAVTRDGQHNDLLRVRVQPAPDVGEVF